MCTGDSNRGQEGTIMKYTRDERLEIGRRIYEGELSRFEAAAECEIGCDTARNYMRMYRAEHQLPAKRPERDGEIRDGPAPPPAILEDYESMSKEQLIYELVREKVVQARLKKGYMVKGAGAQKEFAPLGKKSTK